MNPDTTAMTVQSRNEQAQAELQDTAARVGAYFKVLVGYGIPVGQAMMMAATYNTLVLARHFNVELFGMPLTAFGELGDDDV